MVTTPKNAPAKASKSTTTKAKSSTASSSRASGAAARKASPAAAKTSPVKSAPKTASKSATSAAKASASAKQATAPTRRTVTTSSAMEAAVKAPEPTAKPEPAKAAAAPASASAPPTKKATSDAPKAEATAAPAKATETAKPAAGEPVKKTEAVDQTAKVEKTAKVEAAETAKASEPKKPASSDPKAAPVAKAEIKAKAKVDTGKDVEPVTLEALVGMWAPGSLEEFFDPSRFGLEEGMAAANQMAEQFADVVSDQVDLLSDAGTRMACNCEDFWKSHSQGWDGLYQASSKMAEKSGSIGTEMMAWMQREYDASQADLEKLSKVESLSDFQELQANILSRQVETGLSEATKIRNIWFDMLGDAVSLGAPDGK